MPVLLKHNRHFFKLNKYDLYDVDFRKGKAKIIAKSQFTYSLMLCIPAF